MQIHLDQELEVLRKELSIMRTLATEALIHAIQALETGQNDLALRVIQSDREIDLQENKIDGMLLAIVGLKQPVAIDLRFLMAAMKINNDLERVGDKAASIAKASIEMASRDRIRPLIETIIAMGEHSSMMIRDAFDCFLGKNADHALEVIGMDRTLNTMNHDFYRTLLECLRSSTTDPGTALALYRTAAAIERIGDLAKNISEEAIYYIRGEIIRHGTGNPDVGAHRKS